VFGILKAVFPFLKFPTQYSIQDKILYSYACMILYNKMKRRRLIPRDIEDDVDKELAALPLGHTEGVAPADVASAEHKRAEYTARRQACMDAVWARLR
jgi:hypothetical protein